VALAAAMSVRPTLGLVLIWWLFRRAWKPIVWALGAGLVIIVATLPFVGVDSYTQYLTVLRNVSEVTGVQNNLDLGTTVLRFGLGPVLATIALYAGYALAIVAMLVSLRYDREVSFMVTIGATMLLAPLLWDHYLATLVLPAALLAERGRMWGLALPLLAWLPPPFLPFLAIAGTVLPFVVARRELRVPVTEPVPGGARLTPPRGAGPGRPPPHALGATHRPHHATPGGQVAPERHHAALPGRVRGTHEHRVDREAHEQHVDAGGGQVEAFVGLQ
jgi:hypothetical protein